MHVTVHSSNVLILNYVTRLRHSLQNTKRRQMHIFVSLLKYLPAPFNCVCKQRVSCHGLAFILYSYNFTQRNPFENLIIIWVSKKSSAFWGPDFNFCLHKRPPLIPILIQLNPVHSPYQHFSIILRPVFLRT